MKIISSNYFCSTCTKFFSVLYNILKMIHLITYFAAVGWLTLGPELSSSNYNKEKYTEFFAEHPVIPNTDEIETLRPKSPPPKSVGRGRGRGMGGSSSMTRAPGVGGYM